MAGPKTVTVALDYPFTIDDRHYETLTLRRMRAGDVLVAEAEKNEARSGYLLFAALADVDVTVIEHMDFDDFEKLGEAIGPLLGNSAKAAMANARAAAEKKAAEAATKAAEAASPGAT